MYYQPTSTYRRPRPKGSYFLPFLSLIILGLIVVLVFQMVDYFQEKRAKKLENKAALEVSSGRAEMKFWGMDQWTSALSGSILSEGDALRTAPGSRIVLSLLNGSVIRLSSETEVEIASLKTRDHEDDAEFSLKKGEMWVKRTDNETVRAHFRVTTPHLDVISQGTIFDVSMKTQESVRVLEGKVSVAVRIPDASDGSKFIVVDTVEVALGQEVSLGAEEITDLQNKKPIAYLALLADEFRESDWYDWNRAEDRSSKSRLSVEEAVSAKPDSLPLPSVPIQEVVEIIAPLTAPQIITPVPAERTTKSGNVLITGTVSKAAEKVEVTTFIAQKPATYVLQKYTPGSEKWSYVASREYANLLPGNNRYVVTAVGKDGKRSEGAEIIIAFDAPKEPADLSAPTVEQATHEITEDALEVKGKIGKGIVRVWINDFALTRFVPDSGAWSYSAKVSFGNLKEGENSYEVFGEDADGNKTPKTKFTIIKKPKPPAPPPPPAEPPPL